MPVAAHIDRAGIIEGVGLPPVITGIIGATPVAAAESFLAGVGAGEDVTTEEFTEPAFL